MCLPTPILSTDALDKIIQIKIQIQWIQSRLQSKIVCDEERNIIMCLYQITYDMQSRFDIILTGTTQ